MLNLGNMMVVKGKRSILAVFKAAILKAAMSK